MTDRLKNLEAENDRLSRKVAALQNHVAALQSELNERARSTEESESLLDQQRAVLRGMPDGVCLVSPDWRIEWANPPLCWMLQPNAPTTTYLANRPLEDLFPSKAEFHVFARSIEPFLESGARDEREVCLRTLDGSDLWVRLTTVPADPADPDAGCIMTFIDITRQKQTEADLAGSRVSLAETEAQLQAILRSTPHSICLLDPTWRIIWHNRAMARMFGEDSHGTALEGKSFVDFFTSRQAFDGMLKMTLTRLRSGEDAHPEMELHTAGGRRLWASVSLARVNTDDTAAPWVASLVDVSAQRRLTRELQSTNQQMQRFVEAFKAIPYQFDWGEKRYIYAGPQTLDVLGYPPEKFYDKGFWTSLLHPDDRAEALRVCREASGFGEDHDFEYRLMRSDGKSVWIRDVVGITHTADNRIFLNGLMIDVTERKQLEGELLHSQKVEALGRFVGQIAHDFNNLLLPIQAYAEMVRNTFNRGERNHELLSEVLKASESGTTLIRQLMSYARKDHASPRVLPVAGEIESMRPMLERMVGEDIRLRVRNLKDKSAIFVDSGALQQIVLNLVANARDAMPEGGQLELNVERVVVPQEKVRLITRVEAGPMIRLSIRDTGSGMSDEVIRNLFTPFFTTKPRGQGTGLGLAVVESLVQGARGFIEVESELGRGTTMMIHFPVARSAEPEQKKGTPKPARDMEESVSGTETILLVEDEPAVRIVVGRILHRLGYRVVAAENPRDALEIVANFPEPADLVISDVVMPEMNGYDMVERIREKWTDVNVLFISGYAEQALEKINAADEEVHFLAKPFREAELSSKVRRILES